MYMCLHMYVCMRMYVRMYSYCMFTRYCYAQLPVHECVRVLHIKKELLMSVCEHKDQWIVT